MKEITIENLIDLMRFRPTLKETAEWFTTSEDTIERRIKKWEKSTFAEFKEKYSRHIKYRLIDRAIDLAMSGNSSLMIFCLKNMCGWGDGNTDDKSAEIKPIVLAYSMEGVKKVNEQNRDEAIYLGQLNNYGRANG